MLFAPHGLGKCAPSSDVAGVKFIWDVADTVNGAMAIPNLIGLIFLSRLLFRETRSYNPRA